MTDPRDQGPQGPTTRWVWRGIALAALLIGWVFIAWQNHFHITAPVVFVCLAYLAVVLTVYNLWRTGAAAVAASDDDGDSTWAKPTGLLGELEREKRTLLKAIKEAEFDHQMGKLSRHDADEMIRMYRARAIEVIKEIDHLGMGAAGTPREQIMREVRARIELDAKAPKKAEPKRAAAEAGKGKAKQRPGAAIDAAIDAATVAETVAAIDAALAARSATASSDGAEAATAVSRAPEPSSAAAGDAAAAPTGAASLDDEAMDADSTTAVESTRNHVPKEATP